MKIRALLLILTLISTGWPLLAQNGAVVVKDSVVVVLDLVNMETGLRSITSTEYDLVLDYACDDLGDGYQTIPLQDVLTPSGNENFHVNGPVHTGVWPIEGDPCLDPPLAYGWPDYYGIGESFGGTDLSYTENEKSARLTIGGVLAETTDVCGNGSDCCYWDFGGARNGCDQPTCESAVCAADSFCCNVEWDGFCTVQALELCNDFCPGLNFNVTIREADKGAHEKGPRMECIPQPEP